MPWFRDYLNNHTQSVIISGKKSNQINVKSGVPQGGVLSGMLFSLSINDLPKILHFCKISMYADDAKIYAPINDNSSVQKVQEDIDRVVAWCETWRLKLNAKKCFLIQYNPKSVQRTFNPVYKIGNEELARKTNCRDLGIIISEDLKFHLQTEQACRKANMEINRIKRSFVSRNPTFLSNIFKLYVRPHIEYCVEVWNPVFREDINKMERVQNKMSRLIREGSRVRPQERNARLGISSHEIRRLRGDLINIYKYVNKGALFTLRDDSRLRGNDKAIRRPMFQANPKRHSFAYRSVDEWNILPNFVVNSETLNVFKSNIDFYFATR